MIGSKCDMCSAGFFDVAQGCLGTHSVFYLRLFQCPPCVSLYQLSVSINANKTEGAICPLRIMIVTVNMYIRLFHVPMGFSEKRNEFM